MSLTNISSNATQPDSNSVRMGFVGLILIGIDVSIFAGNCLVIAAVGTTKRLQNVTNLYVVSLAIADLTVSLFVLPLAITVELTGHWPLAPTPCKMWLSMDILLCTASILNLCCISLDRYFAITRPLIYATRRSHKLATTMIAIVWLLSGLITVPPLLGWTEHNWRHGECTISLNKGFRVYSAMGSFFVPFFVMLFVYCNIFIVARQRQVLLMPQMKYLRGKQEKAKETSAGHDLRTANQPSTAGLSRQSTWEKSDQVEEEEEDLKQTPRSQQRNTPLQQMLCDMNNPNNITALSAKWAAFHPNSDSSKSREREAKNRERAAFRREHKTAKTLAGVVGCFSLCWLPFFTFYLCEPFCPICPEMKTLVTAVTWLGYSNSIFNPFIYAFYNQEYAAAFRRLLRIDKCKWANS